MPELSASPSDLPVTFIKRVHISMWQACGLVFCGVKGQGRNRITLGEQIEARSACSYRCCTAQAVIAVVAAFMH
eukprot:3647012-Pleurochrysis_carterae.AAC.3